MLNQERAVIMGGRKKGREKFERALNVRERNREKVTMTNAFNLSKYEASDAIHTR